MSRWPIFIMVSLTVSCAPKRGEGPEEGPRAFIFPEHVDLKVGELSEISGKDFDGAKTLLKSLRRVNRLRDHVLISDNETGKSRERRTREFAQLPAPQKNAVNSIRTRCRITDRPAAAGDVQLRSGTQANLIELLRTTGRNCPADLRRQVHTRWLITSTDDLGESGRADIFVHATLKSLYKEQALISASLVRFFDLEWFANGRQQIEPHHSRTYAVLRGTGTADIALPGVGATEIRVEGEYLERDDSDREIVLYADLKVKGINYPLAVLVKKEDGEYQVERFYIGQTPLSPAERLDIGVDDFIRRLSE